MDLRWPSKRSTPNEVGGCCVALIVTGPAVTVLMHLELSSPRMKEDLLVMCVRLQNCDASFSVVDMFECDLRTAQGGQLHECVGVLFHHSFTLFAFATNHQVKAGC